MSASSKVNALELGEDGPLGPAIEGPEFHYDEILAAAEAEREAAQAEHPVAHMRTELAEAFDAAASELPAFSQSATGEPMLDRPPADALGMAEPALNEPALNESALPEPVLPEPDMKEPELDGPVFETHGEGVAARISIHVFCELGETASGAESALNDRRLSRSAGAVFTGGFAAALARYKAHPTPSLLIIEAVDGAALLAKIDHLAEVCDPTTKVMVIGRDNDIALYRGLMKKGVSEYLIGPVDPLALIGAITHLYQDPAAPFTGRSIAVIGAKGGVGSSIIAHNLAWALAEKVEANTVLVDLDLPFGAAGLNFNQDPAQGVANGLADPDRLDPVLLERMMVRCTDRLSLFAAPATLDDDYDIGHDTYVDVVRKVRGAAPFVVLDLPHLWSNWVRRTMLESDEAVVVATPDLAGLRNAKNLIELLKQGRPNDGPPRLILNQVGAPGRPEIPVKEFAEAVGVEPSLILAFDAKLFGQASNHGQMIEELNPKSKAADGLAGLARAIARRETGAASSAAKSSLLASLFKRNP